MQEAQLSIDSILKNSIETLAPQVLSGWTGETIRIARKAHKLTQAELAEGLGCRQQTISEWEQGAYAPKNAYKRLLDQFFIAKEGGVAQDARSSQAPAAETSSPSPAAEFMIRADQLQGMLKYMGMNGLMEMKISTSQIEQTFMMFGRSPTPNIVPGNGSA